MFGKTIKINELILFLVLKTFFNFFWKEYLFKNNLKSDFSLHTAHKEKIDQSKEKLIQEAMSYLK